MVDLSTGKTRYIPDISVQINDTSHSPPSLEELRLLGPRRIDGVVRFNIDLMVKEVHAQTTRSVLKGMTVAELAEAEKKKHYSKREVIPEDGPMIPFGISSSGELGPCATTLLIILSHLSKNLGRELSADKFKKRI
jgi:hypothetical protein